MCSQTRKNNREFIIAALGTKGDIYPLIGLAAELQRRGFKVTFLSNDYFQPVISKYGIPFVSIGSKECYLTLHKNKLLWKPDADFFELAFADYMKPAIEASYQYVKNRYLLNNNLAVICLSAVTNGAFMAAQVLNIPAVLVSLSPAYIFSRSYISAPLSWIIPNASPKFIKNLVFYFSRWRLSKDISKKDYFIELNKLRVECGLEPLNATSFNSAAANATVHLGLFPEWYGDRPPDWPDALHLVGFPLFDEVNNNARIKVNDFINNNGRPVLFTAGTGVFETEDLFKEGQKICDKLNLPGLFTGGGEQAAQFITSSKCCHVDYVDFEHTLPQCLAIVHHGGIGTLAQAVRAGIPQLIRPLSFDQPENACRVQKMGLGDYVFPKLFKAKYVAPVLKQMIDSSSENPQLQACSADLTKSNAIVRACDLIECCT